ncbi:hypothetical protein [Halomonas sp. H5]|uniref:AbiTii domain-containing protein n=1 Tax=Halomonas sp. H5 TaxID=3423910 RepID=UPI003D36F362
MSGLVLELQQDALDRNVPVSDLLRKAVVVSRKLGALEIGEWLNHELSGYPPDEDQIPSYREIKGQIKVFNPYHGWQPMHFGDAEMGERLARRRIGQAIGELVSIAENDRDGSLMVPYSESVKNALMGAMEFPLEPTLMVSRSQVDGILEGVRNQVLNWALELEEKGIVGDGMSFSTDEKIKATNTTYQITNNIGSMQNSMFQQDSAGASQVQAGNFSVEAVQDFIRAAQQALPYLELPEAKREEFEAELATLSAQVASPAPKLSIVKECLRSSRAILEGAAGGTMASGLVSMLSALL